MGRSTLLTLLLAVVAGAALVWVFLGGDGDDGDAPPSFEAEHNEPAARPGLQVSGKAPPTLRVKPPPPPSPEEMARRERRATLWERALVLHGMRRNAQALALLEPLLEGNKAFFAQKERAQVLAAIRKGARAVLDVEAADERLRRLVDELRRWGNLRPSDDADALEQQLRHAAQVVAKFKKKEERERLLRHLQRFLVPRRVTGLSARSAADRRKRLNVDDLLDRVQVLESLNDEPTVPLPIDEPQKVEERRMEQLELLRQRGALSLLDSLHAGLAWLALHQGADGSFTDGHALALCTLTYVDDDDQLDICRRNLSKSADAHVVSTTALALMAFLDFRDQDGRGLFEPTIARALAWLRVQQREDGLFHRGRAYYTDAMALMALAQAAGATGDRDLKMAVAKGLATLYAARGPLGGYRYTARARGDLSVTGWVAQAVEYAGLAGITVPDGMRAALQRFLRAVWIGKERFDYGAAGNRPGSRGRPSLYPVGMLTGRILLDKVGDGDLDAWRSWLTKGVGRREPSVYTLYYGVRMDVWLHGKLTTQWHNWLIQLKLKQIVVGPVAGAFPRSSGRWIGRGTCLATAFSLLTMEHALFLR